MAAVIVSKSVVEDVMRKFISSLMALALALTLALTIGEPAQASTFNEQYSPYDSNDGYEYIPSGANITDSAVWEENASPGELNIAVFFESWVSRNRFWNGDDYVIVLLDTNNDGVSDYFMTTEDVSYPRNKSAIATYVYTYDTATIVPNCRAQTWMPDGYSDSSDNWVAWSFDKSCLPLGSTMSIGAGSSHLSYFDFTEFWSANTGEAAVLTTTYALPKAKPLSGFQTVTPAKEPDDLTKLSPETLKSVVQVYCADGVGSGWVADAQMTASVSSAGFKSVVITNQHVVEDCLRSGSVTVRDNSGVNHEGTVFASDSKNDLAGIYIQTSLPKLKWQGEKPAQGWWVGVLGSPSSLSGYLTTGIIGLVEQSTGLISVTSPIRPGNSGGPVFDREGRVIGVATAYLPGYENINVAGGTHLLCAEVITCASQNMVWSTSLAEQKQAVSDSDSELTDGVIEGGMLVQRAGSQVFVTSVDLQGSFEIYEDGDLIDSFVFNGAKQAHIVEQRVTGAIQIRKVEGGKASLVNYEMTRTLLWFQNVNLGTFSETSLGSSARDKVSNLVNHRYLEGDSWTARDSQVTKFICTGIYIEGATAAEKLSARKKAKLACENAKELDNDPNSEVSFFFQTKPTKAASYVGKVLVTVKGIQPQVAARVN